MPGLELGGEGGGGAAEPVVGGCVYGAGGDGVGGFLVREVGDYGHAVAVVGGACEQQYVGIGGINKLYRLTCVEGAVGVLE